MNNYVGPEMGSTAELDSLKVHSQYFKQSAKADQPTEEEEQVILAALEHYYEPVKTGSYAWSTYENFMRVVRSLDYTSTPGVPFMRTAPTIGDWLGFDGVTYRTDRLEELWYRVQDLINSDLDSSVWRCFIKMEPHKVSKKETKRWRLIMAAPLDLQVYWQMVFAFQNEVEINQAPNIPSQHGMVIPYGQWKYYYSQWKSQGLTFGSDKTAWDWTCPYWAIRLDLELRKRLSDNGNDWREAADKLYANAFVKCKIMLSNGTIYQQEVPGVMKSGCVNTISINGRCQAMLHVLYSLRKNIPIEPMLKSVGDDTLQAEQHAEDIELYSTFGVKIKTVTEGYEFVGREWNDEGPKPMYTGKHLFNLLHCKDENLQSTLDSYLREYVNTTHEYNLFWYVAQELGESVYLKSRRYYKLWLDNPIAKIIFKGLEW